MVEWLEGKQARMDGFGLDRSQLHRIQQRSWARLERNLGSSRPQRRSKDMHCTSRGVSMITIPRSFLVCPLDAPTARPQAIDLPVLTLTVRPPSRAAQQGSPPRNDR